MGLLSTFLAAFIGSFCGAYCAIWQSRRCERSLTAAIMLKPASTLWE
jgi:ABC-type dipeptide/oligopeptide/nickel transport system permease component